MLIIADLVIGAEMVALCFWVVLQQAVSLKIYLEAAALLKGRAFQAAV